MDYYLVRPPEEEFDPPRDYEILPKRRWSLPGVICPRCRETWANVGTSFAMSDLNSLASAKEYTKPRAVPLEEFQTLQTAVEPLVPAGASLVPGTGFGPLIDKARGKVGDFAWISRWSLLLRNRTLQELERAGVRSLNTVKPRFASASESANDLLELQIDAQAWLIDGARKKKPCSGCGRRNSIKPRTKPLVIDQSTIPDGVPLFRLHDLTTQIVATQEFHDAVVYFEFDHIDFEDIKVGP